MFEFLGFLWQTLIYLQVQFLQIKWIGLILEEDGLVTYISEEVPVSEGDETKAFHKKITSNLDRYGL